jgi:hypothetical protein
MDLQVNSQAKQRMEEGKSQINSRSIGDQQIAGKSAEQSRLAKGDSKFVKCFWLS